MKKGFVLFSLFSVCLFCIPPSVNAQNGQRFYVRVKPEHQIVLLRPAAPQPDYIWIDDEWEWDMRSKQYLVAEGYWAAPKRGKRWVTGHWKDSRRGSYWIAGYWQRL